MTQDILAASRPFTVKQGKDVEVELRIQPYYASLAVCVVLCGRISGTYRGVRVQLVGRCICKTAFTDGEGFVIFSQLPPGFYKVKVPKLCYIRRVVLRPGDNYRCVMPWVPNKRK